MGTVALRARMIESMRRLLAKALVICILVPVGIGAVGDLQACTYPIRAAGTYDLACMFMTPHAKI